MSKNANGGGAAGGGSPGSSPPWVAHVAILRRVLDQQPSFPCTAPAHTVGRWLRDAAKHARRLLPDDEWPRRSLGLPAPGELGSPAPDLAVCLWWFNRMHEVFILGERTEDLDDAVICTLADIVANPPIRKGSKFRPRLEPDWISKSTGKPEPTIVLDLGRSTMRVGFSGLLQHTVDCGHILLACADAWRAGPAPTVPPATGGTPLSDPGSRDVRPPELQRIARGYRDLRDRLLRVAQQMQDSKEGFERLHRLGAQAGQLLAAAVAAGAGHPFDQWAAGPRLEPETPGGPPSEVNEDLWWLHWRTFSSCVGPRVQPLLPGNFGKAKWNMVKQDLEAGITQFTVSQPVSDPTHIWQERIEDHAALCGIVADELDERAGHAESAAAQPPEASDPRPLLDRVLDELELLLDNNRARREFCRRVHDAAEGRRAWIMEQSLPQLRAAAAAGELARSTRPPEPVTAEPPAPGLPALATVPPVGSAGNPFAILHAAVASSRPPTPEEMAAEQAWKLYAAATSKAEDFYDPWAREHATEPPLCCAFLWRWHLRVRPAIPLLPELSKDLAKEFDPTKLPTGSAPTLLRAVRLELEEAIGRRPLTSDAKVDGWTKEELCRQADIKSDTFNEICEKASVPRPARGQHGYRFGADQLALLVSAARAAGGKRKWTSAAERWEEYLDELHEDEAGFKPGSNPVPGLGHDDQD